MDAVIKRFLMKGFVKLNRRPEAKVSLESLEGFVADIGGGGEGIIAEACDRSDKARCNLFHLANETKHY